MTADQNFSRPGAVDLSGIAAEVPTGSYVVATTEANFQEIASKSTRYPVILLFVSGKDAGAKPTLKACSDLANQMAGQLLLGVVDIDTDARIAQALGIQAVPTCVALIAGQMAPLFQGTKDAPEIKALFDQIHQVAVANGLTGTAEPQAQAPGDAEEESDPRFAAADDAMAKGDFATAVAEFDKLLTANPRDAQAKAGKAQASLLERTTDVDAEAALVAADDDLDAQLIAADIEVLSGAIGQGLQRLIGVVRRTSGDERERARARIVELFDTCDPSDPDVKKARRDLAMALF